MRINRHLLNGETLVLDVPGADRLPVPTAISVLSHDGRELEVNSGTADHLEHYLSTSGSTLTDEVGLRTGLQLRYGRYGGDPQQGLAFAVRVGDHEVYGFTTPEVDVEGLGALLSSVEMVPEGSGPVLTPLGEVSWSDYRTHDVAQVVRRADGGLFLLDVRRARAGVTRPAGPGVDVRGGRLSRSPEDERATYVVLETNDFIVYGIPGSEDGMEVVTDALSQITAELA